MIIIRLVNWFYRIEMSINGNLIERNTMQLSGLKEIQDFLISHSRPTYVRIYTLDKYRPFLVNGPEHPEPTTSNEEIDEDIFEFLRTVDIKQIVFLSRRGIWRISHITNQLDVPDIVASARPEPETTKDIFEYHSNRIIVVLDGVSGERNIGTIIRLLEACGILAVIFTENTRFENTDTHVMGKKFILNRKFGQASVGTHKILPTFQDTIKNIITHSQNNNWNIIAVDNINAEDALDLGTVRMNQYDKFVLVFGSEGNGISDEILQIRDYIIEIPMIGVCQSLNVNTAITITIWHFMNQLNN